MKPLLTIFSALADPTRLRIFLLVREMQVSNTLSRRVCGLMDHILQKSLSPPHID